MIKSWRLRELCQTDLRYFRLWEAQSKGEPIPVPGEVPLEGVGTELERIFKRLRIKEFEGCSCKALVNELNRLGPERTVERLDDVVDAIYENAKRHEYLRRFARLSPNGTKFAIRKLVRIAVNRVKRGKNNALVVRSDDGS